MEDKSTNSWQTWNLETRHLVWNLLFQAGCSINEITPSRPITLSPILTSAFTYISRVFEAYDNQPDKRKAHLADIDLFLLTIAALFVACKVEEKPIQLEVALKGFFRIVKVIPPEALKNNKLMPGATARTVLKLAATPDIKSQAVTLNQFKQYKSNVIKAENVILTGNAFMFLGVLDHPFSYLMDWHNKIRSQIKGNSDPHLDIFRHLRSTSVNVVVMILVMSQSIPSSASSIAAAAFMEALRRYPLALRSDAPDSYWAGLTDDRWASVVDAVYDSTEARTIFHQIGEFSTQTKELFDPKFLQYHPSKPL